MDDVRNANNHMRGTEYETHTTDPNAPVRRGLITIDGVVMRFAVWRERMSRQGKPYCPLQLQYVPDCKKVLKAVPID